MKFDQLIDYDKGNIFLENSYLKCGGETSPRPFSKKLKLSISLDLSFIESALIEYAKWRATKYNEIKI